MTMSTVNMVFPIGLTHYKTRDGWELLEYTNTDKNPELELVEFLKEGESSIECSDMLERAVELGNMAGQQHAEQLLRHQDEIPEEWRRYCLVFPSTKWGDHGQVMLPRIEWMDGEGHLCWLAVSGMVSSRVRLVRCK